MKIKILCVVVGFLVLFWVGAVLAQSESQAISLANEAKTILDSAKSKDDYHRGAQKYEAALKIFQRVKSDKGTDICSNELGIIQYRLGQYQKALDYFEQSLVIRKKIGDIKGEGLSLNNIAAIYVSLGQYTKALTYFEQSLAISKKIGNVKEEGTNLTNTGVVYGRLGQYSKALDYYEQSLAISKKIGNVKGEGANLSNIGGVYVSFGQYSKALDYFERSLAISKKIGDVKEEGTDLGNIGGVYDRLGQYSKALEYFERSLVINKKIGNVEGEGANLSNIGGVYNRWGQYSKALDYYEQSLAISKKIGDVKVEGATLNNIGSVYDKLGQYSKALDYYEQSLAISKKIGDVKGEGTILINIGGVYDKLGQYSKALDYYERSLAISKKIGDVKEEGTNLGNIGGVYSNLGQYSKGLDYFEQSLAISKKIGDLSGEGLTLNNLGAVYDRLGQHTKALDYYGQSLVIRKKTGDVGGESSSLWNISHTCAQMGKYDDALKAANESLVIQEKTGVPVERIKNSIANYYLDAGNTVKAEPLINETKYDSTRGRLALIRSDYPSAQRYYENDMKEAEQTGNADSIFRSYTGLAKAYEGMDNNPNAAAYYEKAVKLTEEIRSGLLPPDRENFFDVRISGFRRTDPYDGLARVLIKMKKNPEAFRTSEYTKARLFAESMSRRSNNSSFDIPPEVLEKDRELSDQLAALKKKRQESYEKSDQEVISAIDPQVKTLEENLQTHIKTLRDKYPLFAATKYPEPIDLNQSALKENEWVLEYHVTDTGILIYLTKGKDMVKALFKPLSRDELSKLIVRYRQPLEIVSKRDKFEEKLKSFDLATGKKLFDLLLGDVLDLLPSGASVIIVPDGALGILPFEMLVMNDAGINKTDKTLPYVSGAEFFGDRNPISYSQSVTALTLTRIHSKIKPSEGGLLVLADPVFVENDKRTAKDTKAEPQSGVLASLYKSLMAGDESDQMGGLQFQRLSRTGELAEALAAMYKKNSAVYTGFAASKSNFFDNISPSLNKFNEVVFATHGYFGKDLPGIMEPVLVLTLVPPGIDGYLRMTEVMGLNMNADIVALTACQTGLGKQISGEGTMGMGRAFQYAGARSVLMSLWSVHEVASMNLIKSFFHNMKEGKNKSDALAAARSEIRKNGFDHPFFWAGFILIGEPQ